jgi:hypothetical protein
LKKMENPKIDKLSDSRKVLNFDDVQGSIVNKQSKLTKKPSEASPDVSTGAIQKRKSAYKTIKPSNSLKTSEGTWSFFFILIEQVIIINLSLCFLIEGPSNLVKLRNSHLGKSAPSLNAKSLKDSSECPVVLRRLHHQTSQLRSPAVNRISFTSCLSPRSESPVSRSPLDSPRINSPSANHFQFMPFKRLSANKIQDNCRRWSIVSLPSSSGYASTTTPCSSNISVRMSFSFIRSNLQILILILVSVLEPRETSPVSACTYE